MKQMSKETKFAWLMQQIYDHGKEIHRLRLSKDLYREIELYTHDDAMPLVMEDEIEQVRSHNYYKGYWKALLWVMDMSIKDEKEVN